MQPESAWTTALQNGLSGRMAHVSPEAVFEALDWNITSHKPVRAPHSIWEILNHLVFWQDYCLQVLGGGKPVAPEHAAESWACSSAPVDESDWQATVKCFLDGLAAAREAVDGADLSDEIANRPEKSRSEYLESLIGHNSYHLGQIVLLRRFMGAWPPPSGGDTW